MDFSDFYFVMLVNMYKDSFVRLNLLIIYMCTLSGENGPGPFQGFFPVFVFLFCPEKFSNKIGHGKCLFSLFLIFR